jgi:hypothetical protein
MTDRISGFEPDDDTRRLLGRSDPGHALQPIDPDRLDALLEGTMTQTENNPARRTTTRRLIGIAAAAAVVAAGVGIGVTAIGSDHGDGSAPVDARSVTRLAVDAAPATKCVAPEENDVTAEQVAFEGTVTAIANGVVTLQPTHFYAGPETDLVEVDQPDLETSELPVDFRVGKAYIVGATDGVVSICGLSGLATDQLRAVYDRAFSAQ